MSLIVPEDSTQRTPEWRLTNQGVLRIIVIAPDAIHADAGCPCSSRSYRRRAWCRAEIMSCRARNEGLKPLASDEILAEALDVMGGEFTCCRLGHPGGVPCDREELMLPLLGLYAKREARRCVRVHRAPKASAFPGDVRVHAPKPRRRRDHDDASALRRPHRGRRGNVRPGHCLC